MERNSLDVPNLHQARGDGMKIEVGKYYRTRDGQKVGPMKIHNEAKFHIWIERYGDGRSWKPDGTSDHCATLISEWSEPIDLTAITTPFGLLDAATQQALRDHGGPYEIYTREGWVAPGGRPAWTGVSVYRVKPKPAMTVEVLYWERGNFGTRDRCPTDTHKITITLEDDKPTAIKIEKLK